MNSYIGHPSQLSGVEEYRLIGGKGDGMRLLQVRNGLGLEFTVSPDRAADITRLSYEGVNYSYISPSGYVAAGEKESGITIHYINEHYDEGNTIFQATCPVLSTDSPDDVAKKVHALEYEHFPQIIEQVLNNKN